MALLVEPAKLPLVGGFLYPFATLPLGILVRNFILDGTFWEVVQTTLG